MSRKITLGDKNGPGRIREYKEDAYKSLDAVVQERGYKRPPSYRDRELRFRDDDLSNTNTGRNDKLLLLPGESSRPRRESSSSVVTSSSASSTSTSRTTGKLDAMANSLDAIISDRGLSQDDEGRERDGDREGCPEKRRLVRREFEEKVRQSETDSDSTGVNGYRIKRPRRTEDKMTPYKAVTFLGESFMVIEMKMGKKVKYATDEKMPQKWRCVVKCGAIKGVAESFHRIVAREIACQEFLNALKEVYPDGQIPGYELPNEMLLDPGIYETIDVLGNESDEKISFEIGNDERAIGFGDKPAEMYKCTYHIKEQKFIGLSSSKELARLLAAGKLYEKLTGTEFPQCKYFTGSDCDPFEEYDFSLSRKWMD